MALALPTSSTLLIYFSFLRTVFKKIRRAGVGQKYSRDLGRLSLLPTEIAQKQKALKALVPVSLILDTAVYGVSAASCDASTPQM